MHHTDTVFVGRDPAISVVRPTVILNVFAALFAAPQTWAAIKKFVPHALGAIDAGEKKNQYSRDRMAGSGAHSARGSPRTYSTTG